MSAFNQEAFTPEQVEKGLHLKFVKTLLDLDKDDKDSYHEIHITSDSYCTIVCWKKTFYDEMDSFQYKDMFDDWLNENPKWHKNAFGVWTDADDKSCSVKIFDDGTVLTTASTTDESIEIKPIEYRKEDIISIYQTDAKSQMVKEQ